ncbi:MAG TPA: DUF4936 family protein [Burkholderiales bacterium]|nr:DUF4936 family protein [Burkholderiales bacterium]
MNYYVYYKVSPDRLDTIRGQVQSLFSEIQRKTGVRGRWMHRRDDPTTCMEVYEGVKDERAFEALLEREGAKLGVQRKVERFISAEIPA